MINNTRRTFLKGLTYGSALSLAGASGLALAQSSNQVLDIDLANFDVHLLPTQNTQLKTLNLFNHTEANVVIDGIDQLIQDGDNGLLAIKMKKAGQPTGKNSITLTPGESGAFTVAATRGRFHGVTAHNEALPVTIFNSQAA